jgi:type IV pilus assembly protein PilM
MEFLKGLFGTKVAVAGLDIGSHAMKVCQIAKGAGGNLQLEKFSILPTPTGAIKDGSIVDSRVLADAVRQIYGGGKGKVKLDGVVSGPTVMIRPIIMTQMNATELKSAINFEAEKYLPYAVADATVQGIHVGASPDGDEQKMEVLLVAAPKDLIRGAREVIEMAGHEPRSIDLEPFALLRALKTAADPAVFGQTIALINLGASSSSINIFSGGHLRHNRTITVAGNSFTKAISQSLNLSFEEAEKMKKEKGVIRVDKDATPVAPTTMRIYNVIMPVLAELVKEIQASFNYYRSRYKGQNVDHIFLSGGTACFKNIDAFFYNELGVACHIANPLKNIAVSSSAGVTADELREQAPALMVAVGLALNHLH